MALDHPRPPCPTCGTPGLRILYGLPLDVDFVREHEGDIVIGGCVIPENPPTHKCPECHTSWIDDKTDVFEAW